MNDRIKHSLSGTWNLSFTFPDNDERIETTISVPSNVEPRLAELGLIGDYMPADAEYVNERTELVDDWTYTTVFDAPDMPSGWKRELVFEGIDTVAQIYLNGEQILACQNMHLCYRADVTDKLTQTGNCLKVVIRSSDLWVRKHPHDAFWHLNTACETLSTLRKARHQGGWDNAPRLLTSGIIRPVYIEALPPERFEDVYLHTAAINNNSITLGCKWTYATDRLMLGDQQIRLCVMDGDELVFEQSTSARYLQGAFRFNLPRDRVKLWWPTGFGEAKLYTVRLEMYCGDEVYAKYETPFGFRTLKLDHTEHIDENGKGEFVFIVNGEKVFARGTNWKPLRAFASLADEETRKLRALDEARELNCNMIRIWGGGIYEDASFFDYCDRHGIMVWQDFMFACEIPPMDEEYCRLVYEEAVQVVKRQRNHPSLAIWCGDNECDEGIAARYRGSDVLPSDNIITRKVLREAVVHYDPFRSYVPSSPIVSDDYKRQMSSGKPITLTMPENHLYPDVLRSKEALRACKSLFLGEVGPILINAIATNKETLERETPRAVKLWDAPVGIGNSNHQNDAYFCSWRNKGKAACIAHYGRDFSFEEFGDYSLAINVICAEIFKDVIEYSRVTRWDKTGVLWWSLMDMWPMLFNYSIMDWEYNRKLPWYWIRNSQQEFALMAVQVKVGERFSLYAANDTLTSHTVDYTVEAFDTEGRSRELISGVWTQEKNSTGLIAPIPVSEEPQLLIIRWSEGGKTYTNHAFTADASFETTRKWVKIIGEACGFGDEILELK